MGAKLSCLINGIYIDDYPSEAPLPARPVQAEQLSQQQTTPRHPLQLEHSNEHDETIPKHRRQRSQPQRPRREHLQFEYEGMHGDNERNAGYGGRTAERRERRQRTGGQYDHDEAIRWALDRLSQRHSSQRRSLHFEYLHESEDANPRSSSRVPARQLPRRQSLPLQRAEEYEDASMLRRGGRARLRSLRTRRESEGAHVLMDDEGLAEGQDGRGGSWRGRRDGGVGEAPPSYGDHVFDRRVDDEA